MRRTTRAAISGFRPERPPFRHLPNAAARSGDGLPAAAVAAAASTIAAPGTIAVGGYQFRQTALDAAIAAADPAAMIAALPDALLGQRLAGHASDAARIVADLDAAGANPLVAGAFRARQHLPSP